MKQLVVDNEEYSRIFIKDSDTLVKYSEVVKAACESLCRKDIKGINTPTEIFKLTDQEQRQFPYCQSKILLPILKEYSTLYSGKYIESLGTKEILELFRKNIISLKNIHENQVCHSDVISKNIMINSQFDLQFVDFGASIIDDYISTENSYREDDLTFEEVKNDSIIGDKTDLLKLYLYYLKYGNFKTPSNYSLSIDALHLEKRIFKELNAYLKMETKPVENYYFLDIIDDLLKEGYQSPVLVKRDPCYQTFTNQLRSIL